MTITTEEFILSFHSVSGITIGERRKNLFLLLNKIGDPQNIDFNSIQPKTPLEENFKVEVLIYFRRISDLIEVLKSENPVLIEKVLKVSSWFLEQALERINGEELVKHVFPSLSFNAKVKLVNKLSYYLKNTEQADAIFNAIKEKYGLYMASKLLPCCSEEIIMGSIRSARIEVTPRQLMTIVKKYPQLTQPILEILSQYQGKDVIQYKYKNIFMHVLQTNLLLFFKLFQEFQPSFRLGWRATDRLILGNKQDVIKNAQNFYKLLHKKQIMKSISQDFHEFYLHMFPTSLRRFKDDYNFYLELIPPNVHKMDVILTTFRKKYESELWDDPAFITPGLLELMTSDEREAWMEAHPRPNGLAEDIWFCLTKTDKSVPALKKRISSTSDIKERAELVGCLVETCRINDDKVALMDVCKYVFIQHRNDNSSVLRCFLTTLKSCFPLDNLQEEHWKYINEVVQIFISRNEIPYYYYEWLFAYVHFRVVNNLPIKEQLKDMASKTYSGNLWNNTFQTSKYEKQYLLEFGEVMPEIYKAEDLENHRGQFLHAIVKWNEKHPKDQIPLFLYKDSLNLLLESMKSKEDNYSFSYIANSILTFCIRMKISENEKNEFLNICFSRKNASTDMDINGWLIKYEPSIVLRYIDTITNSILDLWYTVIKPLFWKFCRNYNHLEIPQKMISICLIIINNKEESDSKKKNAINALSYLMQPEEFLNLITPYYPSDLIMDVNSEENQETYKIQQAITGSLKNVIPPSSALQSILNFSKGDYLKFIQRSLYSVSHSVAEEKLPFLFISLTDRAVSVRKHAIYLTFKVLDKAEILKMLTKFMETEKNSSIRKFLFKGVFRYFVKNPDEYSWELVKQNVKTVDINDEEAFSTLMEISKVPSIYLASYMVFTWEFLETLPNPQKLESGKCQLLDAVSSSVIPSLSREFCMGIIQKYLFKSAELTTFQNKIYSFTCKFVIFSISESEQDERLKIIFLIIKDYISTTWYKSGTKTMGRNFILGFLKEFCSYFIEKKCLVKNILAKFTEQWNSCLKPHDAFEEYLYLQFTLFYVDYVNSNVSLAQVGEKLAKLCDTLLGIYGNAAANAFCVSLNSYVDHFLNVGDALEENRFVLIESIVSASSSSNCLIMAVSLLPQDVPTTHNLKTIYNRIVNLLGKNSDVIVQLSLSLYFNGIASRSSFTIPHGKTFNRKNARGMRGCFRYIEDYSSKYQK